MEENGSIWEFDPSTATWSLIEPSEASTPARYPSARSYHCIAGDGNEHSTSTPAALTLRPVVVQSLDTEMDPAGHGSGSTTRGCLDRLRRRAPLPTDGKKEAAWIFTSPSRINGHQSPTPRTARLVQAREASACSFLSVSAARAVW